MSKHTLPTIAETLPPRADLSSYVLGELERTGADLSSYVLGELERIKCDQTSLKQHTDDCFYNARLCRNMVRALPEMELIPDRDALAKQLSQQARQCDEQAKLYECIAASKSPRKFLCQCEILWLWERIGGTTKFSTPRKSTRGIDPIGDLSNWGESVGDKYPDPHGPVISYYRAAAQIVFGKAPSAVRSKTVIMKYKHLNFSAATPSIEGGLKINDDLVKIIHPRA